MARPPQYQGQSDDDPATFLIARGIAKRLPAAVGRSFSYGFAFITASAGAVQGLSAAQVTLSWAGKN